MGVLIQEVDMDAVLPPFPCPEPGLVHSPLQRLQPDKRTFRLEEDAWYAEWRFRR